MKNNRIEMWIGHISLAVILTGQLFLAACTSEEGPELEEPKEYYLKFKVGEVEKKYTALPNSIASFYYLKDFEIYGSTITVIKDINQATKDIVSIQLINETHFEQNQVYILQDPVIAQSISRSRIIFSYFDENGEGYNALLLKDSYPTLEINDEAELKFTEITDSYVKGTFWARVNAVEFTTLAGRKELLITEGEFFLPKQEGPNYK